MKTSQHIRSIIACCILIICYHKSVAQENQYFTVSYKDSLFADERNNFLYNNVSITNISGQELNIILTVNIPNGWSLVSPPSVQLNMKPGENQVIPVTISRQKGADATWRPVNFQVALVNNLFKEDYHYFIKAYNLTNFKTSISNSMIELVDTSNSKTVVLPLTIKNKGNIVEEYDIEWTNRLLELSAKMHFSLGIGKDTNINYNLWVPAKYWNQINKEIINIRITEKNGKTQVYTYTLTRVTNKIKANQNAYQTIPITVEVGGIDYNNQRSMYGAITGDISFNEHNNLYFSYRSRDIGFASNTLQKDLFNIVYTHDNFRLYIGPFANAYFLSYGTGIEATYKMKDSAQVSIYAGLHNRRNSYINNDVYGARVQYKLNKLYVRNEFVTCFDTKLGKQGYLVDNIFYYKFKKKVNINFNIGAGLENSKADTVKSDPGISLGYNILYNEKKLQLTSNASYRDQNFPGTNSGFQSLAFSATYKWFKHSSIMAFYQTNSTKQDVLEDSILYKNVLLYNLKMYGGRVGYYGRVIGVTVGSGFMKQVGRYSDALPLYNFASLDLLVNFTRKINLTLSTLESYKLNYGTRKDDIVFYTHSASLNTPWAGASAQYYSLPAYENPADKLDFTGYTYGVSYGGFVKCNIFKNLSARAQYNEYKSLSRDDRRSQSYSGFIGYDNTKKGISIQLMTNYTKSSYLDNHYTMLTLRKQINMPVVFKPRKYHDLKLVLYNDKNGNGKRDDDEELLKNAPVIINNISFITDNKGTIEYENVPTGNYQLDFRKVTGFKGIVPADGPKQVATVQTNTLVEVPFKKSKMIYGYIKLSMDSISKKSITNDRIRIFATDSKGVKYSTLTDGDGEFYIDLPESDYTISVNPEVFDDTFRPVQMSYNVNLSNKEEAQVVFEIKQKNRKKVMIDANIK